MNDRVHAALAAESGDWYKAFYGDWVQPFWYPRRVSCGEAETGRR